MWLKRHELTLYLILRSTTVAIAISVTIWLVSLAAMMVRLMIYQTSPFHAHCTQRRNHDAHLIETLLACVFYVLPLAIVIICIICITLKSRSRSNERDQIVSDATETPSTETGKTTLLTVLTFTFAIGWAPSLPFSLFTTHSAVSRENFAFAALLLCFLVNSINPFFCCILGTFRRRFRELFCFKVDKDQLYLDANIHLTSDEESQNHDYV